MFKIYKYAQNSIIIIKTKFVRKLTKGKIGISLNRKTVPLAIR
jgi:hypothetical protein